MELYPPSTSPRLAFVGADGHLHMMMLGMEARRISWTPEEVSYAAWSLHLPSEPRHFVWPTWSPDGTKLACLRIQKNEALEHMSLVVWDLLDSRSCWEVWNGIGVMPFYLTWSPDNRHLTFVIRQGEALNLQWLRFERPGEITPLATGVPLFHSHSPDGKVIAIHLGGKFNGEQGRRLYRLDTHSLDRRLTLSQVPGQFGTPVWSPDGRQLAYTALEDDQQAVTLIENGRGPYQRLGSFSGKGTLAFSPEGNALLVSCTPDVQDQLFSQVLRFPLDGTPPQCLVETPLLGCIPLSQGRLLYFAPEEDERAVGIFLRDAEGRRIKRARFYPSAGQHIHLQFLHQYLNSHRLVSPDEKQLVFAGFSQAWEAENPRVFPRIWNVSLEDTSEPALLELGMLAFYELPRSAHKK